MIDRFTYATLEYTERLTVGSTASLQAMVSPPHGLSRTRATSSHGALTTVISSSRSQFDRYSPAQLLSHPEHRADLMRRPLSEVR